MPRTRLEFSRSQRAFNELQLLTTDRNWTPVNNVVELQPSTCHMLRQAACCEGDMVEVATACKAGPVCAKLLSKARVHVDHWALWKNPAVRYCFAEPGQGRPIAAQVIPIGEHVKLDMPLVTKWTRRLPKIPCRDSGEQSR